MQRLLAFFAVSLVLSGAAVVSAQTAHNSAAPINFSADHIELQDKANRALLSGSVSVGEGVDGRGWPPSVSRTKKPRCRRASTRPCASSTS